jgi:hypothetical protein
MEMATTDFLDAPSYWHARWLLERGVALVYLLAFVSILDQWRPLLGERGLTPATELLRRYARRSARGDHSTGAGAAGPDDPAGDGRGRGRIRQDGPPGPVSLFRFGYTDRLATGLAWTGIGLAGLVLAGVPQAGPWWLTTSTFLGLWLLYLSFVEVGRIWYAFGWETLLLEAGVLVAFLGPAEAAPPWLTLLLVRWLLFRVEFGAGLIKLRGDPCWRRLTCTEHHHETQPLPGPLSRWFHHLPRPLHRVEVAGNHLAQLVAPFGLFLPQPIAGIAGLVIVVSQAWLMLSGNFAWLNLLTIVLATAAFSDAWFTWSPLTIPDALATPPGGLLAASMVLALVVVGLSLRGPVPNLLSPNQRMNASHDRLRLVNSYGAFGSVTKVRHELQIEATRDRDPLAEDARWEAYAFRAKPGDPTRTPRQIAPYHLRLDWLLWFAAMDPVPSRLGWFARLLDHLRAADPHILRLLALDPNGGAAPTAVRVVRYRYRFATRAERRREGVGHPRPTWVCDDPEVVVPPVTGR